MEKIIAVIIGKSRDLEHILFEGGWNSNQVRGPSFYWFDRNSFFFSCLYDFRWM